MVSPVEDATQAQRYATEPEACAVAAASAGSGKTKVLTDRVLRLLLKGEEPNSLLCLTFTKTGAAQMLNRLRETLADWSLRDDDGLDGALIALLDAPSDAGLRAAARALYPRALEAPGGLKVQTVHAFCQALLTRFPVEAGVAPGFTALDERGAEEAVALAYRAAMADPDPALQAAISVLSEASDKAIEDARDAFLNERAQLAALDADAATPERIARMLGIDWPVIPAETHRAAACADGAFDAVGLARAAVALAKGTAKTDQPRAITLRAWLNADPGGRLADLPAHRRVFLKADGWPFDPSKMATADAVKADPGALDILLIEAERLRALDEACNAATIHARTRAALTFAAGVQARYADWKAATGRLDYDDLILRARRFLESEGGASWAHFKLDRGIRHILVDEAQDTNPDQWGVIGALARPFFEDERVERTLFLVGDRKQSIFSFQRAAPEEFDRFAREMKQRAEAAGMDWRRAPIDVSFRSGRAVLDLVDAVFEGEAGRGVSNVKIRHRAARGDAPGRVELWPLFAAEPDERPFWTPPAPEDAQTGRPEARMADATARIIRQWVDEGDILAKTRRPTRFADVMVLLRRRGRFPLLFAEACARHGVPMAGADRLDLDRTLAALDLRAAARFLAMPGDDLSLAIALKSPLFGLNEDQLFDLAHHRAQAESLWDALERRAPEAAYAAPHEALARLRRDTDFARPYELLVALLGDRGRARLRDALGAEAEDAVDELLTLALAHEADHPPSLQGFLGWLDAGGAEIKREPGAGRNEVRLMTVHAAKGLEAPIVILADGGKPQPPKGVLWPEGRDGVPLWRPREGEDAAATRAAKTAEKQARDEENRRLLYVAMTRAEDRFCFGGWGKADQGWRRWIAAGFERSPHETLDFAETYGGAEAGPLLRIAWTGAVRPSENSAQDDDEPSAPPDWLHRAPAAEARPKPPLAPSRLHSAPGPDLSPTGDGAAARRRGVLIHGLLEHLPDLPAEARAAACARWLGARARDLDAAAHDEMIAAALAALDAADAAPFFGPDGRAEAALMGVVETQHGPVRVAGRVDRLRIADGTAWLLDYKTDRSPPEGAAPDAYLDQLALYAGLLRQLPGVDRIECALLWTTGPRVQRIGDPAGRLDSLFDRADL